MTLKSPTIDKIRPIKDEGEIPSLGYRETRNEKSIIENRLKRSNDLKFLAVVAVITISSFLISLIIEAFKRFLSFIDIFKFF